jgi:hypothetical protein
MQKLMRALNYSDAYICQGGDYGSFVCGALGQLNPRALLHLNFAPVLVPPMRAGSLAAWVLMELCPWCFDADALSRLLPSPLRFAMGMWDLTAYFHLQATAPDTIGAGLLDSPAFLAAWIVDKFERWSDSALPLDSILDDVVVYYHSGCAATSARYYKEMTASWRGAIMSLRAPVPGKVAILDAPAELFRPPRAWLRQRFPALCRYTTLPAGGHFLAMQLPSEVAADIELFYRECA